MHYFMSLGAKQFFTRLSQKWILRAHTESQVCYALRKNKSETTFTMQMPPPHFYCKCGLRFALAKTITKLGFRVAHRIHFWENLVKNCFAPKLMK